MTQYETVGDLQIRKFLDMPFPDMERVHSSGVTAGCKSGVVGSNKHVNKPTSSEDIQQ